MRLLTVTLAWFWFYLLCDVEVKGILYKGRSVLTHLARWHPSIIIVPPPPLLPLLVWWVGESGAPTVRGTYCQQASYQKHTNHFYSKLGCEIVIS